MKRLAIILGSIGVVVGAGLVTLTVIGALGESKSATTTNKASVTPKVSAVKVVQGLNNPWDVDFLPDDTMLFTERSGELSKVVDGKKVVIEAPNDVREGGEGGLLGLTVDPEFTKNRFIYACFNSTRGDIRIARWVVDADVSAVSGRTDIITGLPSNESGRHSGCQLAFGPDGNLWVGTGDAADESEPQNQKSLGGKVLRLTRDGKAADGNPEGPDKRVYSFGHRNIQALAFYPQMRNGSYGLSVEHGSDRDDEVNELKPGNFGWAPGKGYDESVPMTDTETFPDAIRSVWSSGNPTIATGGAAFLKGERWGRLNGWLAVSVLKDKKLLFLNVTSGSVSGERSMFEGEYGRLRAATLGPDGALYVTTDNGANDSILRIAVEN